MSNDYPTAYDAEKCLLSCVMRGGGGVRQRAATEMRPEMFIKYESLASLILSIAPEGRPDPDTVRVEHSDPSEVNEVLEHRPSPQRIGRFIEAVQESWAKVRLLDIVYDCAQDAKGGDSFQEVATSLEEDIINLTQRAGGAESPDRSEVLREVLSDLEDEQGKRVTGIPTPFPGINRLTRGLHEGALIIPFGSTSMGKTAWALSVALHAAEKGHGVAIHSLEMAEKSLWRRLIQMESGVQLLQTRISDEGWQKVASAAAKLEEMPLYIVDEPGLDPLSHRSSLRRLQYEEGVDLAVVDYLQIMSGGSGSQYDKKHHQVADIAQGLKDTAKILGLPIITPSQTTKSNDREMRAPTLSDLREAGEEPADVCIGLHRPEYYGQARWESGESCEGQGLAAIRKARNALTGEVRLAWVEEQVRWRPLEDQGSDALGNGAPHTNGSPF